MARFPNARPSQHHLLTGSLQVNGYLEPDDRSWGCQIIRSNHATYRDQRHPCPYANICEHCPSFHTDTTSRPILAVQRADTAVLAADAEHRGWAEEAARHHALIARLDVLLGADGTAQTG